MIRRLFWRVVLACAACALLPAHADAVISGRADWLDLWPHVKLLSDKERNLPLEQAIASAARFGPPGGAYATLGMEKEVAWLRVPFQVEAGGTGTWIVNVDYALLQRIDLYVLREGKVVQHAVMGNAQPYALRPIKGRSHAAPIELDARGSGELLLRIDTPGARIVPLSLGRVSDFHARAMDEQILQ